MRQVGVRDAAKLVGALGRCGQPACCARYLRDFCPVSIRMAKDQNLVLSPEKVSGVCGRLLCCLAYEHEGYRMLRTGLPKVGKRIATPSGEGLIKDVDVLRRRVTVELSSGDRKVFTADELGLPAVAGSPADAAAPGCAAVDDDDLIVEEPSRIVASDAVGDGASETAAAAGDIDAARGEDQGEEGGEGEPEPGSAAPAAGSSASASGSPQAPGEQRPEGHRRRRWRRRHRHGGGGFPGGGGGSGPAGPSGGGGGGSAPPSGPPSGGPASGS
jgi:hypothetical protein